LPRSVACACLETARFPAREAGLFRFQISGIREGDAFFSGVKQRPEGKGYGMFYAKEKTYPHFLVQGSVRIDTLLEVKDFLNKWS
jgi:hypothetical protein